MLNMAGRTAYNDDHQSFRDSVRRVLAKELVPHLEDFDRAGIVGPDVWRAVGEAGLLCPTVAEEYGGPGLDFGFNAVVNEEVAYAGSSAGFTLQSDIVADYIAHYGSEEQKRAYLPRMVSGELVSAIAMTEPGAGSDLQGIRTTARRDGNHYVVNGSKTYITNGQNADLIIVAARTTPDGGSKGTSLILIEAGDEGFERGRKLHKAGMDSADTSELFFNEVRVPISRCLGEEHRGFAYMMSQLPQERLSIAISAQAIAQRAFDEALTFTKDRKAFGGRVFDFQNTRFTLAGLATELQVGWAHLDWALARHMRGELTAAEGSAAKLWHTELQGRVCDTAVQLHGGAGFMNEYIVSRLWRDARVTRIFGGTSEIMKEVIGRSL